MNNTSSESATLSTEQQTVFNWLNDELEPPVYAEVYKGALNFLGKKPPGYITMDTDIPSFQRKIAQNQFLKTRPVSRFTLPDISR